MCTHTHTHTAILTPTHYCPQHDSPPFLLPSPSLPSPLQTCAYTQVWSWILCAIISLLFVTITSLVNRRFENGNIYHLEKKKWSPYMQALVLNAGKLDEAALALSTEPLVRAYLMPSLKVPPRPVRL